MIRLAVTFLLCLHSSSLLLVESAKQQLQLSESYLPVAMQVIAHLADQMAYEFGDEPTKPTPKPSATTPKPTIKPTYKPTNQKPLYDPSNQKPPSSANQKPSSKPPSWPATTQKPYVFSDELIFNPANSWWMSYGSLVRQATTPFHRPGLYAPVVPPKPDIPKTGFVLLPFDHNSQYTVIAPQEKPTEEPLLSIHQEEVKPLMEPAKEEKLLPPHFDAKVDKISRRAEDLDELTDENLQYLSKDVRDLIKMAHDPDDERVVDVFDGIRGSNSQEFTPKGKLSASNLRLLLLYDLLSREAKRQRLSDYTGFSPSVMKTLVDSSSGGARAQLSLALSRMVERRDCEHDYANNRAKEMVQELAKDESTLSNELRYLQPLVYKF